MAEPGDPIQHLRRALASGDAQAQGEILAGYRGWLEVLARMQLESRFQAKFDASDVVQQTLIEAHRDLVAFRGTTEAELLAWLRKILAHALAHEVRRYAGTKERDLGREVSLERSLAASSQRLREVLAAPGTSPSRRAVRREEEVILAEALSRLPDDYRQVIVLRNLEGLAHEEIARKMDRGVGAVRMLWVRALARLREIAGELEGGGDASAGRW
jgi:RNA polymerase sigma-70 factor (ECF subfamily)